MSDYAMRTISLQFYPEISIRRAPSVRQLSACCPPVEFTDILPSLEMNH
jgi:hypothetical protein